MATYLTASGVVNITEPVLLPCGLIVPQSEGQASVAAYRLPLGIVAVSTPVLLPGGTVFVPPAQAVAPIVTDAGDESYENGETGIVITGSNFGATKGSGSVVISPTDNVNDAGAVAQTVTEWSDTSITFTAVLGTLPDSTNCYLFVTSDSALSNSAGHVVQIYLSFIRMTWTQ